VPDGVDALVAAANADPVTSSTEIIVRQGPWAAATVLVSLAAVWLVRKVIERGWRQHDAATERQEAAIQREIARADAATARADAAEARSAALERDYREKVVPVLTDVYRVLADFARGRGG